MAMQLGILLDELVVEARQLTEETMALESDPQLAQRRAYLERILDQAATFLADIYAAVDATHEPGIRGRLEAEAGFASARRSLAALRHSLSLLAGPKSEHPVTSADLLAKQTYDVLALLLATGVAHHRAA